MSSSIAFDSAEQERAFHIHLLELAVEDAFDELGNGPDFAVTVREINRISKQLNTS